MEPSTVGAARAPWVATVCRNRDSLKFSAFAWRSGGAWRYELFLFALENPLVACFARLEEIDRESAGEFFQAFATEDLFYWRHSLHIVADKFSFTDMSGSLSEDWSMVLMDCDLHRSGFLTSDLAWAPLEQVVDMNMLSAKASKSQSARSEKGVVVEDEAWLDLPWLLDMAVGGAPVPASVSSSSVVAPSPPEVEESDDDDDVDMQEVLQILHQHREAPLRDGSAPRRDFYKFLRGDTFAFKHTGMPYDCWRAQAGAGEPAAFATQFGFGKTSDFHISAYGDDSARSMADGWVHKVCYFFDQWVSAGRRSDIEWGGGGGAAVVAVYREPEALLRVGEGAPVPLQRRLTRLRGLGPMS